MSDVEQIKLLTEIKEAIKNNTICLSEVKEVLKSDRLMMWKIMALTIVGAFAIIGVKIAFP